MTAFQDWADTAAADLLELPINGRTYTIRPLGWLDGVRLREEFDRIAEGVAPTLAPDETQRMLLGDALDQMRADNVSPRAIFHASSTAHIDAIAGREQAKKYWEAGPSPEAIAAAVKAAAALRDASTTSPSTDEAASSMTKPASTSGTKTPRKASPSTGQTSSRTRGSSQRTSRPSTASGSGKRATPR